MSEPATGELFVGPRSSRTATRYLCAGAYLDRDFRDGVIKGVLERQHRAVAPSYSIDIVPIIKHCLAARTRERIRDLMIVGVIVVALALSTGPTRSLLECAYGVLLAWRAVTGFSMKRLPIVVTQGFIGLALLSIGWPGLSNSLSIWQTIVMNPGYWKQDGTWTYAFGGSVWRPVVSLLLLVVGIVSAQMWYRLSVHATILNDLTDNRFDPGRAPGVSWGAHHSRLEYLAGAQYGNVTMYAQDAQRNPMVGSGPITKDSWNLALPLTPDEDLVQGQQPKPITAQELYTSVRRALVSLSDPQDPNHLRIHGLSLQDRVFVSGLLPTGHPLIGPNYEPRMRVTKEELLQLTSEERNRATHYLTIRISGWEGDLDVTNFVYFSIRGHMLYIEYQASVLPPIHAFYRQVDVYERMSGKVQWRAFVGSVAGLPRSLVSAPVNLVTPLVEMMRRNADTRARSEDIAARLAFDFGAHDSVREIGAETGKANLFHQLDSARYVKVVSRRIIEATTEVLTEAGYDIHEFVRRTNFYIDMSGSTNQGVSIGANSKGTYNAGSAAPAGK